MMIGRALSARAAATAFIRRNGLPQLICPNRRLPVHSQYASPTDSTLRSSSDDIVTLPGLLKEIRAEDVQAVAPELKELTASTLPHLPTSVDRSWQELNGGLALAIQPEASWIQGEGIQASSTLKKRRLKMNRHKYRKRKKRDRKKSK